MANNSEIYNFGNNTVTRLRENYNSSGQKASGKWGEALESQISFNDKGINIKILGLDYTRWITPDGRGANKTKSPDQAKKLYPIVLRWMQQKGIQQDKTFAFRIALKWVYKGINVPNKYNKGDLVDSVINREWYQQGIKIAGGALLSEFNSDVLDRLKL